MKVKAQIKEAFDRAFEKYDLILAPAAPDTAPEVGKSLSDPMKMYLSDVYTAAVNLCGLPAICLPCGKASGGMPVGVQFIGGCFQDRRVLKAAAAYEKSRGIFPLAFEKEGV